MNQDKEFSSRLRRSIKRLINSPELSMDSLDETSVNAIERAQVELSSKSSGVARLLQAMAHLLLCTDLNLDEMEDETRAAIKEAEALAHDIGADALETAKNRVG
jgi:ketopantoate hydroxymethyltransferase